MLKTLIGLSGAALIATGASAGVFSTVADLSGATSEGEFGEAGNTVIVVPIDDGGAGLEVVAFGWILSFEAFSPSWGSEARIDIESPSGTVITIGGDDFGWSDSSGLFFNADDTSDFNGELLAGDWTFTFYESFDDDSVDPDGFYHTAIFVWKAVPAPGALALVGLAGLTAVRRRRSA